MNKEQAKNKIEILEKELEELKEIINKEDEGHWKPKKEERFYCIDDYGFIYENKAVTASDFESIALGNYFKTQEEAEDMVKFKKIMNKYCYRFSLDELKDEDIKIYTIFLDVDYNELEVEWLDDSIASFYTFKTKEDAQKAIDELTPELFLNCVGK